MKSKAAVKRIIETLKGTYPDGLCSLRYEKDYELLFAVRLSAQCTDARVNQVTPALYARFPTLESFAEADPAEVIARCVAYKAGVVERDEKEQGERKLLNLGHTVGHAIEKCSGYAIPHGHAVAAGLAIMARASARLGWMSPEGLRQNDAERICSTLRLTGLPVSTEYAPEALAEAALADKKRSGDAITIVVPKEIGHCELMNIPVSELLFVIGTGWEA